MSAWVAYDYPPKNDIMPISNIPDDTLNQHYYNCDVAHTVEVKNENNRYTTPVNVEFGSTESDSTVNIASKHRKLFAAFKLLDPPMKIITDDDTVIHHLKEFPMRADYMQQNSPSSMIAKPDFPVFLPPRHRFHQNHINNYVNVKDYLKKLLIGNMCTYNIIDTDIIIMIMMIILLQIKIITCDSIFN